MQTLEALLETLFAEASPMPGSEMTDEEAIAFAKEKFPPGSYCLLRHWLWIDLDVGETERQMLTKTGRQPTLLLSHQVVYDAKGRWEPGAFVRTSLLHKYEDAAFKTMNTLYLLLGPGQRVSADPKLVASIFF